MNGEDLKKFRKKFDLTQHELAKIAGTGIRGVQGWEQNQRKVPQSAIILIEQYIAMRNKNTEEPRQSTVSEEQIRYNKQNENPPPQHNYEREMIAVLMEGNALMRVRNEQHEKQQEAMMTMLTALTKTIVSNSEIEAAKAKALAVQNKTLLKMMEEVLAATLKKPMEHVVEMTNKIRHEVLMEVSD